MVLQGYTGQPCPTITITSTTVTASVTTTTTTTTTTMITIKYGVWLDFSTSDYLMFYFVLSI